MQTKRNKLSQDESELYAISVLYHSTKSGIVCIVSVKELSSAGNELASLVLQQIGKILRDDESGVDMSSYKKPTHENTPFLIEQLATTLSKYVASSRKVIEESFKYGHTT